MDNCLCYSKDKGLYTKYLLPDENPEELLFRPNNNKGERHEPVKIPQENITIIINSYFDYGQKSYLNAIIKRNDLIILDFDTKKLQVLCKKSGVKYHCVMQRDWESLYNKLILAYQTSKSQAVPLSSIEYIDSIFQMMDMDELYVKNFMHSNKLIKQKDKMRIAFYAGRKLKDFIDCFDLAQITDKTVIKHTINTCNQFLENISDQIIIWDKNSVIFMSEIIFSIHKFMQRNNCGVDFLNSIRTTLQVRSK